MVRAIIQNLVERFRHDYTPMATAATSGDTRGSSHRWRSLSRLFDREP